MSVRLEAMYPLEHYDPTATYRVAHFPGERFDVSDSVDGTTAEQLANTLVALGVAKRIDDDAAAATTKPKSAKAKS
jgi:hypothetical protein